MCNSIRICVAAAVVIVAAACTEADGRSASSSLALTAGISARTGPETPPPVTSEAFDRRFGDAGAARLVTSGGIALDAPDFCAIGGDGTVYFGAMGWTRVGVWSPAGNVETLELDGPPLRAMGLATRPADPALYVLNGAPQQVQRHDASGELTDYVPLNGGQIVFVFHVFADGRILTGGIRRVRADHTTLLAVHEPNGRLAASFHPLSGTSMRNKVRVAPPVQIAMAPDGSFLAAESGMSEVHRFTPEGESQGTFEGAFQGYRPQVVVTETVTDPEQTRALLAVWDPLVFLHRLGTGPVVGFETRVRGQRRYRLETFDDAGRPLAGGLLHESRPLCGDDSHLILVETRPGAVPRLLRYASRTAPGASVHAKGGLE